MLAGLTSVSAMVRGYFSWRVGWQQVEERKKDISANFKGQGGAYCNSSSFVSVPKAFTLKPS